MPWEAEQVKKYGAELALMDSVHYRNEFMDAIGEKLPLAMNVLVARRVVEAFAAAE